MSSRTTAAFATPLPCAHVRQRCLHPAALTIRSPTRMSITSDLIVKAIEVGAASYATRAVAPHFATPAVPVAEPEPRRRGLFRRRKKPAPSPPPESTRVVSPVDALFSALLAQPAAPGDATEESRADVKQISGALGNAIGAVSYAARRNVWIRLAVCLLLDLVGSGSLGMPIIGDVLDIVTAPIGALLLHTIFADPRVTAVGLAEELLPGTDFIPTATIAWVLQNAGYLRYNGLKVDPRFVQAFAEFFESDRRDASPGARRKRGKERRGRKSQGRRKGKGNSNNSRWW